MKEVYGTLAFIPAAFTIASIQKQSVSISWMNTENVGAGELAQLFRKLADFPEDPGLVSVFLNCVAPQLHGIWSPLLASVGTALMCTDDT